MDIRLAGPGDGMLIGRLLHAFNTEYDEPTPTPEVLAARIERLGDTDVLLAGEVGLVVLRFQPSIWTENQECYLAELYVQPAHRGRGLGEALLDAALTHAIDCGADYIHLGTTEDDVAARHLYAKLGFRRTEGDAGPLMFVYEKDLR